MWRDVIARLRETGANFRGWYISVGCRDYAVACAIATLGAAISSSKPLRHWVLHSYSLLADLLHLLA